MAYQNFQVCKEIYLPIPKVNEYLSISEYKERFGIDLKDYIELADNEINFKFPYFTKLYAVNTDIEGFPHINVYPIVYYDRSTAWNGVDTPANTFLGFDYETEEICIMLKIAEDSPFELDSLRVSQYEI